ncbi:glycosyl transferase [Pedobacter sp. KBW06]|uniref:glycosyl transferase n=1 Tax=Pedobacter sp. KBW06 TaxID=2153359 RepID=UPI000F594DC8|nr:glycosyl transferase [Pedobacter sp. KBW06]RQO72337.1 glycosyl transferase [Pedobacter sp. KBW06]
MLKFCTLFNTTYLSRGLAMYRSLEQHCTDFHLYIFAFDQHCFEALNKLELPGATIVSLKEFENQELLAVKPGRTAQEYCWTCASSTIKYCIETFRLDHCTYVDADLLFFKNPQVLIDEMAEKSVLITEHRYTPDYNQSATSGIYCVQFMTFKNTEEGMSVLNWWVNACLDWCFSRYEDNKFGDQKYLDDWTERFSCVHVLKHLGGGVAPWNVQQYAFKNSSGKAMCKDLSENQNFDLVFYHYHGFSYSSKNSYMLTHKVYRLNRNQIKHIYKPYVKALSLAEEQINASVDGLVPYAINNKPEWVNKMTGRYLLFSLLGSYRHFYAKWSLRYSFF